jgi:hypothetical protein
MRLISLSVLAAAAAMLTACGGGGGGGASPAAAPSPSSTEAPTAGPSEVQLSRLTLGTDTLVRTAAATQVSSVFGGTLFKATSLIAAVAQASNRQLNVGPNNGFTNRLVDGRLISLQAQLKDKNGKPIPCDTSKVEVKVHKIWGINPGLGHSIARLSAPKKLSETCDVEYGDIDVVVIGDDVIELADLSVSTIVDVLRANDPAFNQSPHAILLHSNGDITQMVVDGNKAKVQRLTKVDRAPSRGHFIYNGKKLAVVTSNAVEIREPGSDQSVISRGDRNGYWGLFLNDQGDMLMNQSGGVLRIDEMTGATTALPRHNWSYNMSPAGALNVFKDGQLVESRPTFDMQRLPYGGDPLYGATGRHGDLLMSDRCTLWNMASGEHVYLQHLAGQTNDGSVYGQRTSYSRLEGEHATCISTFRSQLTRYNVVTQQVQFFDLDDYRVVARSFSVDGVKVTVQTTTDRLIEFNFETGRVADFGKVGAPDRAAVELIPRG